jgi:hypothetical protein
MVWCAWFGDALYVVSGPGEQDASVLDGAGTVAVTLRGDHGGRVVTWSAAVSAVAPGSEEWESIASQLAGKRLNATGGAEETVARWAADCTVYALRPAPAGPAAGGHGGAEDGSALIEAGSTLPSEAVVEEPRPSPAIRTVRKPFVLHRVRRR